MTKTKRTIAVKRTISVNAEYRLLPDGENVQIERLVTVDPTKSPHYKTGDDATIRKEWRNIGKYYATIPKALSGLLDYSLVYGKATTLREVLREVTDFRADMERLLGGGAE